MYSVGVDIGGSHISSCMYEHTNKRLVKSTFTSAKVNPKGSKEEIIRIWSQTISKTIAKADVAIAGVGLAVPGPFDYYNGISKIADLAKLDALLNVNIRSQLAEKLDLEPASIRFINDATAFSIAEALVGKAAAFTNTVALTLGTGLGSSFLINAQPQFKADTVPEGGFLYDKHYNNQLADAVFSTRGIIKKYEALSGKTVKNVEELCARIENDSQAETTLWEFGKELGEFLKPYLADFDAEVLVLGGNIAKAYEHFQKELVKQLPEVAIYVSSLGEEAAMVGAALLLDDDYYDTLKPSLKLI